MAQNRFRPLTPSGKLMTRITPKTLARTRTEAAMRPMKSALWTPSSLLERTKKVPMIEAMMPRPATVSGSMTMLATLAWPAKR